MARPTNAMKEAGWTPNRPYNPNQVGTLTEMFREWVDKGVAHSTSNEDIMFPDRKSRFKYYRQNLLVGVTKQVWAARENVANAIGENFAQAVIGPMVAEAKDNMSEAYATMMAAEPYGTKNRDMWPQDDPSQSDAFKFGKGQINGQERELVFHRGWENSRNYFRGNKLNSFALSKIRYQFFAIDQDELDKVLDRPVGVQETITVVIPFYQRKSRDHSKVKLFSGDNPSPGPEGDKNYYCKILTFPIHSRTEKRVDKRTGQPWRLWRAIEYGQVTGRYKRVMVKNVTGYKAVPVDEKQDTRRDNTIVAYTSSVVTDDQWVVFMSPKWQWWSRQSIHINGDIKIMVDKSDSYDAGLAPIRKAIMRNSDDARLKSLIAQNLDSAMLRAGFRRG